MVTEDECATSRTEATTYLTCRHRVGLAAISIAAWTISATRSSALFGVRTCNFNRVLDVLVAMTWTDARA